MTRPKGALNKTPQERELEREQLRTAKQNRAALRRKLPTKTEQRVLEVLKQQPHVTLPQLQQLLVGTIKSGAHVKVLLGCLRRKGLVKAQSQLTIYWVP